MPDGFAHFPPIQADSVWMKFHVQTGGYRRDSRFVRPIHARVPRGQRGEPVDRAGIEVVKAQCLRHSR